MPDIDNLSIKIKAESDIAAKSIDKLIEGLNAFSRVSQNIGKIEGFSKLEAGTKRLSHTFEEFEKKYEELGKAFRLKGDFSYINKQIDSLSNKLAQEKIKEQELSLGGKTDTAAYENSVKNVVKITNMIGSLKSQLNEIHPPIDKGNVKMHTMSGEFEVVNEKIHEVTQSATEMEQAIQNAVCRPFTGEWHGVPLPSDLINTPEIEQVSSSIQEATNKIVGLGEASRRYFDLMSNFVRRIKEKIRDLRTDGVLSFKNIGAAGVAAFSKIFKSSKKTNLSFGGGFKTILKYAFGIRSLFVLFNKLRSGIVEGMKNLVQYSNETNASVSLLKNSLTQLKNASAAAVAPLLNALAPALNSIIQLFVKAANAVNQLLSAITGKNTWIRAKTLTDNYAKSLNGVAKAIQNGIRSFDELNVITTQKDNGGGTSAADMFETVPIENKFKDLAEKFKVITEPLKKLFQDIKIDDWFAAGQDVSDIAKGILKLFTDAIKRIDWRKIGQNIAKFLNGIDWVGVLISLGTLLREAFKAIVNLGLGFFESADLDTMIAVGLFAFKDLLVKGLTALANATIFSDIGLSIGGAIVAGIGAAIVGFKIGQWLYEAITGEEIDMTWAEQFQAIKESFSDGSWKQALSLWGHDIKMSLNYIEEYWREKWDAIKMAVSEKLQIIGNTVIEKWTSVKNTTFDTIEKISQFLGIKLDGIKAFFQGTFRFIEGIVESLRLIFQGLIQFLAGSFAGGWRSTWEGIKNIFKGIWNAIATILEGVINGIVDGINSFTSGFRSAFSTIASLAGKSIEISALSHISIAHFASGGFVENPHSYSLFMAGENGIPEMLGTVGGKTAVVGGQEITGIQDAIYSTTQQEIELLRQQNSLLQGILEKEYGITTDEIGRAARKYAIDYKKRTNKEAYAT